MAVCDSAQAGPDIHFFRMLSQKISPPPTSPIIWSVPEGTNFSKAAIEFTKLSLSLFVIIIFFVEEEEGYHRQKLFFVVKNLIKILFYHLGSYTYCLVYFVFYINEQFITNFRFVKGIFFSINPPLHYQNKEISFFLRKFC